MKTNEFLCRYAGDEFLMLIRGDHERAAELERQLSCPYVIQGVTFLLQSDSSVMIPVPNLSNYRFVTS